LAMSWMRGIPLLEAYASAKAAIVGFTNTLARALGPYRIRVKSCTAEWSAISGAGPANALPPNGRYIRPINSKMMTTTTTRPTRPLGNIPSRRYKAKSAVNQSKSGSE